MAGLSPRVMLLPGLLLALAAGASDGVEARGSRGCKPVRRHAQRRRSRSIIRRKDRSFRPKSRPRRSCGAMARKASPSGGSTSRSAMARRRFTPPPRASACASAGSIRIASPTPTSRPRSRPELAAAHSWTPDAATWQAIKRHSVASAATVTITGFRGDAPDQAVSRGKVAIRTSKDAVGAPIFYRDVPLMPSELEKGVIKPLAAEAMPLVAWRVRNVGEAAQPGGDGEPAGVRQLPFVLRATARPWEWIWMACRATGACTSWRRLRPRWRSASRT